MPRKWQGIACIISIICILQYVGLGVVDAKMKPLPHPKSTYDVGNVQDVQTDDTDKENGDKEQKDCVYIAEEKQDQLTNYPVSKRRVDTIIRQGNTVDIMVTDMPVVDLLNDVASQLNKSIVISSNFPQRVTLSAKNLNMDGLLSLLALDIGINWYNNDNVYTVSPSGIVRMPKFIPVQYANLDKLKSTLGALGFGGRVVSNDYPRGLLANVSGNDLRIVEGLIKELDVLEPSIRVEFVVVEINKSDESKFGLNWDDVSANYRYSKLVESGGMSSSNKLDISRNLTAGITSILTACDSSGKIIAKPYIITANAEKARLSTGDEIPIFTKDYNGNPAVSYKKVGIELNVVPRIVNMSENILSIDSKTTVNIISGQQTQQGLTAPQISSREAEDTLDVRSGEVVVIGGLIKEEDIKTSSGIPLLKKIPILGKLFQTTSKSKNYTDILIFIKPTIIKDPVIVGDKADKFDPWKYSSSTK